MNTDPPRPSLEDAPTWPQDDEADARGTIAALRTMGELDIPADHLTGTAYPLSYDRRSNTAGNGLLSLLEEQATEDVARPNYLRQARALALGLQLGFQAAYSYHQERRKHDELPLPVIRTYAEPYGSRQLPLFSVVANTSQPTVLLNETGWWDFAREVMLAQEAAEPGANIETQYNLSNTAPWAEVRAIPEDIAYLMGIRVSDYLIRMMHNDRLPQYEQSDAWLPVAANLTLSRGDVALSQEITAAWHRSLEANRSPDDFNS